MIYHFCNRAFGRTFRLLAAGFARRHRVQITTVVTASPDSESGLDRPMIVPDVNAPDFLGRIAPGDQGVVTGFNQIFRQDAIARFASLANIHASVLPFYRGPSPAYWCIEFEERTTGFTLHEITTKIDSGPILYQEALPIDGEVDPEALSARIAIAAGPVFLRYLDHLRTGEPWEARVVDAAAVYSTPVTYRSFPPRKG